MPIKSHLWLKLEKRGENIFDLKNISDISTECKNNLKLLNMRYNTKYLLELFDKKNPLSIDEIIVAFYRLYKVESNRIWISNTLYDLKRKKIIIKNGKYYYKVIDTIAIM